MCCFAHLGIWERKGVFGNLMNGKLYNLSHTFIALDMNHACDHVAWSQCHRKQYYLLTNACKHVLWTQDYDMLPSCIPCHRHGCCKQSYQAYRQDTENVLQMYAVMFLPVLIQWCSAVGLQRCCQLTGWVSYQVSYCEDVVVPDKTVKVCPNSKYTQIAQKCS